MKILDILRHAKSSWDNPGLNDFDRPLNKRGKRDAPFMGEKFAELGIKPQLIISSAANRALTTARIVAEKNNYAQDKIIVKKGLYLSGVREIADLVNHLDNQFDRVMIVGHNPGFTESVSYFCQQDIGNLPTCGLVSIEFKTDDWAAVSRGAGTMIHFEYPKKYA